MRRCLSQRLGQWVPIPPPPPPPAHAAHAVSPVAPCSLPSPARAGCASKLPEHLYPASWMHAIPAKISSDPHSFIRANGSRNSVVPSTAAKTTPIPRTAAT